MNDRRVCRGLAKGGFKALSPKERAVHPELPHLLAAMAAKFETRAALEESDRDALLSLPFEVRKVSAKRYIVREGERSVSASLILSGLAFRHRVTSDGARQILSLHIPSDFVDLEGALLRVADHSVQALTDCQIAVVPRPAMVELIEKHGRLAHALWVDTLIDASVFREWIVNVGQRPARAGLCHLLCEYARRLEAAGIEAEADGFELPMTQEQLADALGITSVHVNRVLRDLDSEGLIVRQKKFVRIPDWKKLRKVAGFNEMYLHLDQVAPMLSG